VPPHRGLCQQRDGFSNIPRKRVLLSGRNQQPVHRQLEGTQDFLSVIATMICRLPG
jgi:hypothetical protein